MGHESKIVDGIKYYIENLDTYKFKAYLRRSKIPERYHDIEFENYFGDKSIDSVKKCEKYVEGFYEDKFKGVNLFLSGGFGTQKTAVICNIGKGVLKKEGQVKFVYASELIDLLMKNQGFSYYEKVVEELDSYMEKTELLLLDDFGKGVYWKNNTELIIDAWDKFLRKFLSCNKRVVISSNYSLLEIKKRYGDGLYNLLERNFVELSLQDSITGLVKKSFENLWD